MLNDLYSSDLLEAAASIPTKEEMADADASARKVSRVCGSEVEVHLKMDGDVVSDISLDVQACALGQASSSIFARAVRGATLDEIARVRDEMHAMLKEDGPPPSGERWAELKKLEPIRGYPARHASTMLVFEAAADCADQIAARRVTPK